MADVLYLVGLHIYAFPSSYFSYSFVELVESGNSSTLEKKNCSVPLFQVPSY